MCTCQLFPMPQAGVAALLVAVGLQLSTLGLGNPVHGPERSGQARKNNILPPSLTWLFPSRPPYLGLPPVEEHLFKREVHLPWHRFQPTGDCPHTPDGYEEFFCPTPDSDGTWHCIEDIKLCDGVKHCPHAEDEQTAHCLYYRVIQSHLNVLAQQIISYTEWLRNPNSFTRTPHYRK